MLTYRAVLQNITCVCISSRAFGRNNSRSLFRAEKHHSCKNWLRRPKIYRSLGLGPKPLGTLRERTPPEDVSPRFLLGEPFFKE